MTYDNNIEAGAQTSVSALFDSQADAERAVDRLVGAGIGTARIRVTGGDSTGTSTGAAAGAGQERGFWDSLGDFFLPDEDRYSYAEGLSRGGYLVTVNDLNTVEYDTVLDILDDEGTVNLDEREASWRSEGWGGYESSPYATERSADTGRAPTSDEAIPVVEERLRVGKRDTSHGRVRVRAYTVETPVSETIELRDERVELVRTPVDRAAEVDADYRERTLEAEEHREEAVVSKEARVVEEIGLRKTSDTHQEAVSDTVRHTEVEVDDDRTNLRRDDLDRNR
jgi:stress response protein YsnF